MVLSTYPAPEECYDAAREYGSGETQIRFGGDQKHVRNMGNSPKVYFETSNVIRYEVIKGTGITSVIKLQSGLD